VTGIGISYGSILENSDLDFESSEDYKDGVPYLITTHSKGSCLTYMYRTKEKTIFKCSSLNLNP